MGEEIDSEKITKKPLRLLDEDGNPIKWTYEVVVDLKSIHCLDETVRLSDLCSQNQLEP